MLVIFDLISFVFFGIQISLFLGPLIYTLLVYPIYFPPYMIAAFAPFALFLGMILVILFLGLVTRLIGKIEDGVHPFPLSKNAIRWNILFAVKKFTSFYFVTQFIFSFATLRFLYMWASKAKNSLNMMHANLVSLQDLSFVEIGKGSMFGLQSMLAPHQVVGKNLVLKKIKIGKNVQFHFQTFALGGVEIGDNSIIGTQVNISLDCKIGQNVKIGPKTVIDRKTIIEDNVKIGELSFVSKKCIIKEGVNIPAHSFIPENTTVDQNNEKNFFKYKEC